MDAKFHFYLSLYSVINNLTHTNSLFFGTQFQVPFSSVLAWVNGIRLKKESREISHLLSLPFFPSSRWKILRVLFLGWGLIVCSVKMSCLVIWCPRRRRWVNIKIKHIEWCAYCGGNIKWGYVCWGILREMSIVWRLGGTIYWQLALEMASVFKIYEKIGSILTL